MRTPLSWLRDFAPFGDDVSELTAALDDLGLVVEEVEHVGEGLDDVVVARVEEIATIEGADKIRRVVVDAGGEPVEVVCGAWNFAVGDLVPLAPVGAVLPGGVEMTRRKMRGVVSNGMLCSGSELRLSDDHRGILVLEDANGTEVGQRFADALGIEPDVVFDIAVEANRPDAFCIAGVARDLAARLRLPFAIPEPAPVPTSGEPADALCSVRVEDLDLCPRFVARVLTGVAIGPSPRWLARRLMLAGMRPINNVVDASNYVMLELGQPTHPYDLDRLDGSGIVVRRADQGERLVTLDGVERTLGERGPILGDEGRDCLICDARSVPVGIGGVMGGASTEIGPATTRVLLEVAYFDPMAIARTSKRLNLRTEASARFERGVDPAGIDRAADRFVELVAASGGPGVTVAPGTVEVTGEVPRPMTLPVRTGAVNGLLGTDLTGAEMVALLEPLGMAATETEGDTLSVTIPTFRPDIRPAPLGEADVTEEVARTYGYARLPRRQPSWPQPGRLTPHQRGRRLVKDVMVGMAATEVWTPSIVAAADHARAGMVGPAVEVTNPLVAEERWLRRALLPGALAALAHNVDRRQGDIRIFEVGVVFPYPASGTAPLDERELLAALFHRVGDDARTATAAWWTLAGALGVTGVRLEAGGAEVPAAPGLHPTRSARLVVEASGAVLGSVGEVDPEIASTFGIAAELGRRIGWLEADLGMLLDPEVVPRRSAAARPVSRYPSSDVDLAFVLDEQVPAASLGRVLAEAGGELLESVELFDVFRGDAVGAGRRSLAYRLRFCALDRTLTDAEVGELRAACIAAAQSSLGAVLR